MKTFILAVIAISCTLSQLPASMAAKPVDPYKGETNFVKPTVLSDAAKKCLRSPPLNYDDKKVAAEQKKFRYFRKDFNHEFNLDEKKANFAWACYSTYGEDIKAYAKLVLCLQRLKLTSQYETALNKYTGYINTLKFYHGDTKAKKVLECSKKSDFPSSYTFKVLTKNGSECAKKLLKYDLNVNNLDIRVYTLHKELNYFMQKHKRIDGKKVVHDDGKDALSFCFFRGELIGQAALPKNNRFTFVSGTCVKSKVTDSGFKELEGIIERFANTLDPYADKKKLIECVLKK